MPGGGETITNDVVFELKGEPASGQASAPAVSDADVAAARRRPLVCRSCGHLVTYDDARIAIDGEHEHLRVNPSAFVYRFGCFSEADGCAIIGEPTEAFTWFTGCKWQYAHCRGCRGHLGWRFSGAQLFFGLLLERLVTQQ